MAAKLPRLHKRLAELGCDMTILATDWFLCLYATSLPCEVRPRAARRHPLAQPPPLQGLGGCLRGEACEESGPGARCAVHTPAVATAGLCVVRSWR